MTRCRSRCSSLVVVFSLGLLSAHATVWAEEPNPRRVKPGDRLCITLQQVFPDHPVDGAFVVAADGTLDWGSPYEKVALAGATSDEAVQRIQKMLTKDLLDPIVACLDFCDAAPCPCQKALAEQARQYEIKNNLPPDAHPLTCQIHSEATCVLGSAPRVTVEITNKSKDAILLAGYSGEPRLPLCHFTIIGPDGKSPVPESGFCGNRSPLVAGNFVEVVPGKTFDPYGRRTTPPSELSKETFRVAGDYRLRFTYTTRSSEQRDETIHLWLGDNQNAETEPEMVRLIERVPATTVESNEITVTVIAPKP